MALDRGFSLSATKMARLKTQGIGKESVWREALPQEPIRKDKGSPRQSPKTTARSDQ